jgi:hypothetical protein
MSRETKIRFDEEICNRNEFGAEENEGNRYCGRAKIEL